MTRKTRGPKMARGLLKSLGEVAPFLFSYSVAWSVPVHVSCEASVSGFVNCALQKSQLLVWFPTRAPFARPQRLLEPCFDASQEGRPANTSRRCRDHGIAVERRAPTHRARGFVPEVNM